MGADVTAPFSLQARVRWLRALFALLVVLHKKALQTLCKMPIVLFPECGIL